jgi:hypothetical protein
VLHCAAGDVLIALSALALALFLVGDPVWPKARFYRVALFMLRSNENTREV